MSPVNKMITKSDAFLPPGLPSGSTVGAEEKKNSSEVIASLKDTDSIYYCSFLKLLRRLSYAAVCGPN